MPALQYRKPVSCSSEDVGVAPPRSVPLNARDYVESLHQNNKATLLYGKNNVHVQPVSTAFLPQTIIEAVSVNKLLPLHTLPGEASDAPVFSTEGTDGRHAGLHVPPPNQ